MHVAIIFADLIVGLNLNPTFRKLVYNLPVLLSIKTMNNFLIILAPWLKVCKRSDPNLDRCLNEMFTLMFPELAKGKIVFVYIKQKINNVS